MTKDEENVEVARAVREYSGNKGRIACLDRRLSRLMQPLRRSLDNPSPRPEGLDEIANSESDPRQDACDLLKLLERQDSLKKFFHAQGLSID